MYFVYILYSSKFERFYVGMTLNVEKRLNQHSSGKTKSTKAFAPWSLFYIEKFQSSQEARTREKYLKSAAGRRWRKNNLTAS